MVETIMTAVLAVELAYIAVQWVRELWGNRVIAPESLCTAEMSETDLEMQQQTVQIMRDTFGTDINESIQKLSAAERIQKAEEFVNNLTMIYGLDIKIEFFGENRVHCGHYNMKENSLNLNVADLLSKNEENIYEFFDTIFHELRHAVQWKAVQEEGFWNVEENTREQWLHNFDNYISVNVDPQGYALQTIEADARTFATGCLKGVMNHV